MIEEKEILNKCTNLILESMIFSGVEAVGIAGSVGRKEKKITNTKLNDVDFFVIANTCDFSKKIKLETNLKKITKTFFTDILFLKSSKIKKDLAKNNIPQFLYDLTKSSLILYITPAYKNIINDANNKNYKITYESAVNVIFTRLWCVTGPYTIKNNKIFPIDHTLTFYQMKKAITAIIDATLICESLYSSSYLTTKIRIFLKSQFYQNNKTEMDLLLKFFHEPRANFETTYKLLIKEYRSSIYYIIKNNFFGFLFYCLKLMILSLFRKRERKELISTVRKIMALRLTKIFFTDKKTIISKKLSNLYIKINQEIKL